MDRTVGDAASSGSRLRRPLELPRRASFGRDHWLGRSAGFRVESVDGRRGRVQAVVFASQSERPDLLVVQRGTHPRRAIVPVGDVLEVDALAEQVIVRAGEWHDLPRRQARRPGGAAGPSLDDAA